MLGHTTFRTHILKLVLGLLAFSFAAILANVWITTTKTGQTQVIDTLNVGERVLTSVFANRQTQLINSAQVLTDDFGFKQAVATRDASTIQSVLNNHGARIDADLMGLLSLDGRLLSSTVNIESIGEHIAPISDSKLLEVLNSGGSTLWTVIQGQLYQAILITVDAPTPIAIALVGFKVDQALLQNFDAITQLNTTIELPQNDDVEFVVSTLPKHHQNYSIADLNMGLSWITLGIDDNTFVSRKFALSQIEQVPINVTLSANVDVVFSTFKQLQSSIFAIAIGSLILALFLGITLSKRLTLPLSRLVQITQKLAGGAYDTLSYDERDIQEVRQLTSSFKIMQENIQQREQKIRFQAQHDLVTGLFNRAHLGGLLSAKLAAKDIFQVIGIRLGSFRQLNDTFGHENVDIYLRALALRLVDIGGVTARVSPSEFLWIPDTFRSEQALRHLRYQLKLPISINRLLMQPKMSLISLACPKDADDIETLFRRVNISFVHADKTHQDLLPFNAQYERKYTRRLDIIRHLKAALGDMESELSMVYQPKLNLANNKITKVEALIRWNSHALGFVPPDEFIEIAEHANLIYDVTRWVIKRVIRDVKAMHSEGQMLCAAINLSAKDIMYHDLLPWILSELSAHDLPICALSFELTESDLVTDAQTAALRLQEYRDAGFHLAIDDFGTGYSSLAYLQKLPVSDLKIDKSFVLNLAENEADQKIVTSIIALAKSFGMRVIAEGIEDEASLKLLRKYKCDWAQGFYICRPVPLLQLLSWLETYMQDCKESIV